MKAIYLVGVLIFSITINALACDEKNVERGCTKGSEHSWNPSSKDTTARLNRFYSLEDLISVEYERGNYDAAIQFINEYLELADLYRGNWNYGNAIHDSYRYLGLISYSQGDLNEAAKNLIKAGESTGSPQLSTFGPELDLANLLLHADKTEEVKVYLNGIKKFWEMDNGVVDSWLNQISSGEKPELSRFGNYGMSLAANIINWLSFLWPALISLIVYLVYRGTLSILKFLPASILLAYIVTFASSYSSFFLIPPIIEVVPASLITLSVYMFSVIFSFIIPGLAALYLTKAKFFHAQKDS